MSSYLGIMTFFLYIQSSVISKTTVNSKIINSEKTGFKKIMNLNGGDNLYIRPTVIGRVRG